MDKKITIAVVAVIVIAIVAIAAFFVLNNDSKKDYSETTIGEIGTCVPIYGNATSDLYINDDDVNMLQQIVDGDLIWDKKKAPFADANQDGVIDSKDVSVVKSIINKEKCTVHNCIDIRQRDHEVPPLLVE